MSISDKFNDELTTRLVSVFTKLSEIERIKNQFFKSRAFNITCKIIKSGISFDIDEDICKVQILDSYGNNRVLGDSSSKVFIDVYKTGSSSRLESSYEPTDLLNISGLGPVKVKKLNESGISSVSDLIKLNLKIGDKIPNTGITYTEQINTGVKLYLKTGNLRISRDLAYDYLRSFKNNLLVNNIKNFEMYVVGSYRRLRRTVGDLDIIIVNEPNKVIEGDVHSVISNWMDEIFVNGDKKISGIKFNTQVDVRFIERKYLGAHILHGTGSREFNVYMRTIAKDRGLKLNEYGIIKEDGEMITFENEKEIFKFLNIEYVKPENRG